jgi:hypothetical protein
MVYDAAGTAGIETLFEAGQSSDGLYRAIESTLGLTRAAFERAWRQRILDRQ